MKKAFSLLELLLAIALSGAMAYFAISYINYTTQSRQKIKTEFLNQLNLISASIFQCKILSNQFPVKETSALANDTLVSDLECNTTTPYDLDGGKNSFIPKTLSGFSPFRATQNANEFYFSTSTTVGTLQDEVLKELNSTFSANQYEYTNGSIKFYLSR